MWVLRVCLGVMLGSVPVRAADGVSFRHDVMAVLSKAGCNLGTCHGNARGKGGFQLSLRGQDPDLDYITLAREWQSRRTNVTAPAESLLLRKATMQIAHEGGRRFDLDSVESRVLQTWIGAGMPDDSPTLPALRSLAVSPSEMLLEAPQWSFTLSVKAQFADGSTREVAAKAVYEVGTPIVEVSREGSVRGLSAGETVVLVRYLDQQVPVRVTLIPTRPSVTTTASASNNVVDRFVDQKLARLKLAASPLCDDATFVRRTTLDFLGTLPTAEEAKQFVNDPTPTKREAWIDQLLERPEFAGWWAVKWADMLRVEEKTLDAKGAQVFHAWLRNAFAEDRPMDELVRQLIAARGSTYEAPPANFYRALRDPFARSEAVGQLFLGVRLQCAKCHNHPFDRWTQNDYYSWANVFAQVDYKVLENNRRDSNDKHEFDGEQIVVLNDDGKVDDPRTDKPRPPQFLGANQSTQDADRLAALADWLTRPENDRFAQMLVNRAWRHLMGRGLVEPVDDFRATNPPSHPELLQSLANELRSGGYRLKPLLRTIALSEAYQRSSVPVADNAEDEINYSHTVVRRLTAEQLADGLVQATGGSLGFAGLPDGTRAASVPGVGAMLRRQGGPRAGDQMLRVFGKPQRLQSCECERSDETTLAQAFWLLSGSTVQQLVSDGQGTAAQLVQSRLGTDEKVNGLYWRTLSRAPSPAEHTAMVAYLERHASSAAAWEDLIATLVTAPEFLLRR